MEKETIKNVRNSVKHWYLPVLLGVIFIAVGLWVLHTPLESYMALAILFAVLLLITGIIEISFALSNRKELAHWGWSLSAGIIDFIIGIILVSRPAISMIVLPFYVCFIIMFRSMLAIGWAIELKRQAVQQWGYFLAAGIIGVVFAFIMLWNPVFAGMTIVFYTGCALIVVGGFNVYLGYKLRNLSKN